MGRTGQEEFGSLLRLPPDFARELQGRQGFQGDQGLRGGLLPGNSNRPLGPMRGEGVVAGVPDVKSRIRLIMPRGPGASKRLSMLVRAQGGRVLQVQEW